MRITSLYTYKRVFYNMFYCIHKIHSLCYPMESHPSDWFLTPHERWISWICIHVLLTFTGPRFHHDHLEQTL